MKALFNKKGNIGGLKGGALALVTLAMTVGIGLLVLDGFQAADAPNTALNQSGSEAYNAIGSFITGIGDFANWPATIVVILVGAAILVLINKKFN